VQGGGREGGGQPAQLYRDCAAEELALGVVVDGDGESKVLVGDGRGHRNVAELLEMQLQQNNGDHCRQYHMSPKQRRGQQQKQQQNLNDLPFARLIDSDNGWSEARVVAGGIGDLQPARGQIA